MVALPSTVLHRSTRMYFVPHRRLLNQGSIRIDEPLWKKSSPEEAKNVADIFESFDEMVQKWGFRIPQFTKVILVNQPILPGVGPVFCQKVPLLIFAIDN